MYAPVSLWRPSGVPWSPPLCRWLLRGRRGTMCTAKGSAVHPGVSLASVRCPLVSATLPVAFAWQAWENVHCQGLGCTSRRPSGVLWSLSLCRWLHTTHTHTSLTHTSHTYTHSHTHTPHIYHTHTLTKTHTSHTPHTHTSYTQIHTDTHR